MIISTFPISDEQFRIIEDGQVLYIAILVAWTDDNVEVIEKAMESQGVLPSQSAEATILQDCENRRWFDIRFEPICPDDVTEEINEKYDNLYYLAPSAIEPDVERDGLIIAKGNSECWCSKAQNFEDGDMSDACIQEHANKLYAQAISNSQAELSPNYTLFMVDLSLVGKSTRFFYDNSEKRLYTKVAIPPFAVIGRRRIIAQGGESK